jgi:hypothetical protein
MPACSPRELVATVLVVSFGMIAYYVRESVVSLAGEVREGFSLSHEGYGLVSTVVSVPSMVLSFVVRSSEVAVLSRVKQMCDADFGPLLSCYWPDGLARRHRRRSHVVGCLHDDARCWRRCRRAGHVKQQRRVLGHRARRGGPG